MGKIYAGRANPAVAGVSFAVPPGQCFGLLGLPPFQILSTETQRNDVEGINGAGKSTLFRLMNGFERPTFGSAKLLGSEIFEKKDGWHRY